MDAADLAALPVTYELDDTLIAELSDSAPPELALLTRLPPDDARINSGWARVEIPIYGETDDAQDA